jgi:outer membrane protein OmpA-like peptidoglycan-associated protein
MRRLTCAVVAVLLAAVAPAVAQQVKDAATIRRELGIDAAAPAPAVPDGTAPGPRLRGGGLLVSHARATLDVLFLPGSPELTALGRTQLDQLGAALQGDPHRFRIEGHTDTTGGTQTNLVLSQRRAETVVAYLVSQCGIDRARLDAVGLGKQGLAVPTADQVAEPRNRRVVVVRL